MLCRRCAGAHAPQGRIHTAAARTNSRRSASRLIVAAAAAAAATAKAGDYVTVKYTGSLDDGTVFDASQQEFELGGGVVSVAQLQPWCLWLWRRGS
jgi:FKBP-type peptidyl-prolyl cis-trans isomerase